MVIRWQGSDSFFEEGGLARFALSMDSELLSFISSLWCSNKTYLKLFVRKYFLKVLMSAFWRDLTKKNFKILPVLQRAFHGACCCFHDVLWDSFKVFSNV